MSKITGTLTMCEDMPIDEWTEKYFPKLVRDIECHITEYGGLEEDDCYQLRRLIFISIRENMISTT